MTPENHSDAKQPRAWETLDPAEVLAAMARLDQFRPRTVILTHTFKLRGSRYKEQELLWAQVCVTNMAATVLSHIWEDMQHPKDHGFLAFIRAEFERLSDKTWLYGNRRNVLSFAILKYCNATPGLTSSDYRITSNLRQGVTNLCAQIILSWTTKVQKHAKQPADTTRTPLALIDLLIACYQQWNQLNQAYAKAQEQVMPFGTYRGKPFRDVTRRELRWLRERLPAPEVIETTLDHVHVLLNQHTYKPSRIKQARDTRHPWQRTRKNKRRAVRASRYEQYQPDVPDKPVFLAELNPHELTLLQQQLTEMQEFAGQFERLRSDVETILQERPPSFPSIPPVPQRNKDERIRSYHTDLTWFTHPFPSRAGPDQWDSYQPWQLEQFEAQARAQWLHTVGTLQAPSLLPLTFTRTMYPPKQQSSFALLYTISEPSRVALAQRYSHMSPQRREQNIERDLARGAVYRYTLAVNVHGKNAFKDAGDGSSVRTQRPVREDESDLNPKMRQSFFYVNFPQTPFAFPRRSSIVRFPIQCGQQAQNSVIPHGEQVLNDVVARQKVAQEQKHQQKQRDDPSVTIEESLPDAPLGSAQIISQPDEQGHPAFFLLLPVPHPVPPLIAPGTNIIAFHEDGDSYSYAVLTPDGVVLEIGDVDPPLHVRRRNDREPYSDNYVHEMANALVTLAVQHQACIGFENTAYRKQATASRKANRQRLAHPTVKLASTLRYKALLSGLPAPHMTGGVPYHHACGQCGTNLDDHTTTMYMGATLACGSCRNPHPDAHVSLPVLVNTAGETIWMHVAREQKNQTRAREIAHFLAWVVTDGNTIAVEQGYPPLSDAMREEAMHRLEQRTVQGTAVWPDHAKQQAVACTEPARPRIERIYRSGAPAPLYQQWIDQYRAVAPHLNMVFQHTALPPGSEESPGTVAQNESCTLCGSAWNHTLWFDCVRCGTHLPARYNIAIVTARRTQEQLVERKNRASKQPGGEQAESDDALAELF